MQARKMRVQTFYEKHFKSQTCSAVGLSDDEELGVLHVLSMFTPEAINLEMILKTIETLSTILTNLLRPTARN